jgi:hypothetical protein
MRLLRYLTVVVALVCGSSAAAADPPENWADYSLMFSRSAGQHWTAQPSGQWAWSPQSATESLIYWGDPANWAAAKSEKFVHDGDWVRLAGFGSDYQLRTTVEWTADADCTAHRTALAPGGSQRYVKWLVPSEPYCMFAAGTITQLSTGKAVMFAHQQAWSTEQCSNQYLGTRSCLKQVEHWWDDNMAPWGEKVSQTQYIGKGAGMAYRVDNGTFHAELKYIWTW